MDLLLLLALIFVGIWVLGLVLRIGGALIYIALVLGAIFLVAGLFT